MNFESETRTALECRLVCAMLTRQLPEAPSLALFADPVRRAIVRAATDADDDANVAEILTAAGRSAGVPLDTIEAEARACLDIAGVTFPPLAGVLIELETIVTHETADQRARIEAAKFSDGGDAEPLREALRCLDRTHGRYVPPPVDALPEPLRSMVSEVSRSLEVDPSFALMPGLAAVSASIGNTWRVKLKRGRVLPLITWAGLISKSGTGKTPAGVPMIEPLGERDATLAHEFDEASDGYRSERERWQSAPRGTRGPEPAEPTRGRLVIDDATTAKVARIHSENPRGLFSFRDELSAFFGSMDEFKPGGKGSDRSFWLKVHSGTAVTLDRVGNSAQGLSIRIPKPFIALAGGLQPAIARAHLCAAENAESGLVARFLLAWPPDKVLWPTDATVDPAVESDWREALYALLDLPLERNDRGEPAPRILELSPEAVAEFRAFEERAAARMESLPEVPRAGWSKVRDACGRLAGCFALLRCAHDRCEFAEVTPADMAAAIRLAEWFGREQERIFDAFALRGPGELAEEDRLLAAVARAGDAGLPLLKTPGAKCVRMTEAEALKRWRPLQDAGRVEIVRRVPSARGGRPRRFVRLVRGEAADGLSAEAADWLRAENPDTAPNMATGVH